MLQVERIKSPNYSVRVDVIVRTFNVNKNVQSVYFNVQDGYSSAPSSKPMLDITRNATIRSWGLEWFKGSHSPLKLVWGKN